MNWDNWEPTHGIPWPAITSHDRLFYLAQFLAVCPKNWGSKKGASSIAKLMSINRQVLVLSDALRLKNITLWRRILKLNFTLNEGLKIQQIVVRLSVKLLNSAFEIYCLIYFHEYNTQQKSLFFTWGGE